MERNTITQSDALELCASLEPQSVDMILADLPYGVTQLPWDSVIPLEPMWAAFRRVIRPRGAIVLTASQPFTSALVMSNREMFRYEWVWDKLAVTGYLDAHRKPLRRHENVLVFCDSAAPYFPQMSKGSPYKEKYRSLTPVYGKYTPMSLGNDGVRYPTSVITMSNANRANKEHNTEKPVALFAYLIRTYTRPGDLVLDPVCGSGTTAVAARETGRDYVCGDSSAEYVKVAQDRLAAPYTPPLFVEDSPATSAHTQLNLLGED